MKLLPVLVGVMVLAGCTVLPEARETFYYALEYQSLSEIPESAELGAVRVFEPAVSPAYDRRQIVLRGDSVRYQYLSDDMWGVELGAALQMFVERYYEDVATFSAVRGEFDRARADYEIHSAIRRVEYVEGETPRTRVELLLELRAAGGGRTLVRHVTDYSEPVESGAGLERFATEVNRIMLESIADFDGEVREALGVSRNDP